MRYVSKIIQWGVECCFCSKAPFPIIEISDEDSSSKEILDFGVVALNERSDIDFRRSYADVFGLGIDKRGYVDAWKITDFDLKVYDYIDFVKAVRNPNTSRLVQPSGRNNIIWEGPTNALRKSAYTLYYSDECLVTSHMYNDYHTLGAVLRQYLGGSLSGEYVNVSITGNLIKVKLYLSTYHYRICDLKSFNKICTKCMVLCK